MPYSFNYASITQYELGVIDIETKHFEDWEGCFKYFEYRLDKSFNGVYVAFLSDIEDYNTDEYPSALITRSYNEMHKYFKYKWLMNTPLCINIFEYPTYENALEYLHDYFETSSIAYNDEVGE